MKLLTATTDTQGARPNDFHHCVDGELVTPSFVLCPADQADPARGCGCGRAFAGLASHQATTTALVADLAGITPDDVVDAVLSSLERQGWPLGDAEPFADAALAIAGRFPTGAVIERRLDLFAARLPTGRRSPSR